MLILTMAKAYMSAKIDGSRILGKGLKIILNDG